MAVVVWLHTQSLQCTNSTILILAIHLEKWGTNQSLKWCKLKKDPIFFFLATYYCFAIIFSLCNSQTGDGRREEGIASWRWTRLVFPYGKVYMLCLCCLHCTNFSTTDWEATTSLLGLCCHYMHDSIRRALSFSARRPCLRLLCTDFDHRSHIFLS